MSYEVNKIDLIAINGLNGIGNKTILELMNKYGKHWEGENNLWEMLEKFYREKKRNLNISKEDVNQAYEKAKVSLKEHNNYGIKIICYFDPEYPQQLRTINNPPILLYVKGNIDSLKPEKSVAVIGTRKPTEFGKQSGFKIAMNLAEAGLIVVSGLATGCDTAGHQGCLKARGKTVAVLAHGLHTIYPIENKRLAEEIVEKGGCLVSEYPYGHQIFRNNFVERDRLQSGLSTAVIVIETDIKGGTMHTVRFSQEQERLLACIHHPIEKRSIQSQGNEKLIREGKAIALADKEDVKKLIEKIKGEGKIEKESEEKNEEQLKIGFEEKKPTLIGKELAVRLGVTASTISNHKKKGNDHFQAWSKGKDPDQLSWKYSESAKHYLIQL